MPQYLATTDTVVDTGFDSTDYIIPPVKYLEIQRCVKKIFCLIIMIVVGLIFFYVGHSEVEACTSVRPCGIEKRVRTTELPGTDPNKVGDPLVSDMFQAIYAINNGSGRLIDPQLKLGGHITVVDGTGVMDLKPLATGQAALSQ